ncbi:helix-turn-helix domain-containing protein [Streptomyces lancefieldiae]|uniref:Helix-turn-helix domain-containing protein n=1 Tax=Streptomyces lancefieldiae TaxID=3075520 RepID=A0ABU3AYX8_9ACTN|nr:helix-turn-helix domain-containing protein [Streptomyces sp. DSM 40712]MDT0615060.1 helix-turn-helix domain-containing protein [Streptomyces sp. DSM 40712]
MTRHALRSAPFSPSPQEAGSSPATATGPVIGRALRILGAFSAQRPHLSLSELARRSGLPVSTVHRMLGDLLVWGALERGAQGRYRIGLRLWEVASLAPRSQGLRERALPYLETSPPSSVRTCSSPSVTQARWSSSNASRRAVPCPR